MVKKDLKTLRLIVPITYLIMITINSLANIIPINGRATGEISDNYGNLFAPAGITFSIWGVIYILLALFTIYFTVKINHLNGDMKKLLIHTGIAFSFSSIINAFWILAWHYDFIGMSLILMCLILISLIYINIQLRTRTLNMKLNLLIKIPFTVYLGWITVATIANVTTYLVWIQWDMFSISEVLWTNIILVIGAVIGLLATLFYRSYAYNLVILWAYGGILIKHLSKNGFNGEYVTIIISIIVSLGLLVLSLILLTRQKHLKKLTTLQTD